MDQNGVFVREHERRMCEIPCVVSVENTHREAVRLAASSYPDGTVRAQIVDFSERGFGLLVPVFLPKLCRVTVTADGVDGEVQAVGTLRRIEMRDRSPTYLAGLSLDRGESLSGLSAIGGGERVA